MSDDSGDPQERPKTDLTKLIGGGAIGSTGLAALVWFATQNFAAKHDLERMEDRLRAVETSLAVVTNQTSVLMIQAQRKYE